MTTYDNFAHTFSESRKNMKWEEIEYFLQKYAPFGEVLDVGCGNGRLFREFINYKPHQTSPYKGEEEQQTVIASEVKRSQDYFVVPSRNDKKEQIFSSYLGIDSSEKLLEEAKNIYNVIPSLTVNLSNVVGENEQKNISANGKLLTENFQLLDMRDISKIPNNSFDSIFFIASFHHLEREQERIQVLQDTKKLLKSGGKVFLTNWALESEFNRERYSQSKILGSENEFGGTDFQIKIGEFQRYYHSFTFYELENIAKKTGFEIIENRLFETEKNFITILKSLS